MSQIYLFFKLKTFKAQCSTPYIYIGCYADVINGDIRDLSGLGTTSVNQVGAGSVKTCVAYCATLGYIYAGVQNS